MIAKTLQMSLKCSTSGNVSCRCLKTTICRFVAAVGLFDNIDIIESLYEDKEEYIGDSDSDTDIWNYILEHGYRHYDEIVLPGEIPEMVFIRIARCILKEEKYAYER